MLQTADNTTADHQFFLQELARLGPDQPPSAWSLEAAEAYCRRWAKQQYENFTVVSFVLPRRLRQDFYNVYSYCRWSDNLADEVAAPDESLRLLAWWQQQLSLCYGGRPSHPVMLALQRTIQRHALPRQPLTDLLSAFRQDQTQTRYQDDSQLLDYCRRSANPVGRIVLRLADADNEETTPLSDHICTGLQLANFCQDMARDTAIGRIYAPRSRWQKHGVTEAMLLANRSTVQLQAMLGDWVTTARSHFYAGWPLVDRVPRWLATDVDLFARGGLAILEKIEDARCDVWTQRPSVSKVKKLQLLGRSLLGRFLGRRIMGPKAEPSEHA